MTAFAYYRLPYLHHAHYVVQHEGEPEVLFSVAELNGKEGFVIAPFSPSSDCPVLLIHPDESKLIAVGNENGPGEKAPQSSPDGAENASRRSSSYVGTQPELHRDAVNATSGRNFEAYAREFECFHQQLSEETFSKIVLARKVSLVSDKIRIKKIDSVDAQDVASLKALFLKTCRMYPRLFVALVYTSQSGMWLMATPEILLKGEGDEYQTMSLAGTQKAEPSRTIADYPVEGVEWSEKNREEQQYVTDYIEDCIKGFAGDYRLKGPYTTMAANLYHLRTDISFRLLDKGRLGDVINALYPTPAVCGIPKDAARRFILQHELHSRKYYSGFVGPISSQGKTHLFVSLRCMNILQDGICELYAGGGLLKESEMDKEWKETEAKMQTIRRVFL